VQLEVILDKFKNHIKESPLQGLKWIDEKGEIVAALFAGFNREAQAFGYVRAYSSLMNELENGLSSLEQAIPYDLISNIKKSDFSKLASTSRQEFEDSYVKMLDEFICPITHIKF
jgi:hypothetical protein